MGELNLEKMDQLIKETCTVLPSEVVPKLIREPKVYKIAGTVINSDQIAEYLDDRDTALYQPDGRSPEILTEVAARLCYNSFTAPRPGGTKAMCERLLGEAHGSCLEHSSWSLLYTGVSRSLTHELVRHRAGMAYSQRSQRYVDESLAAFIVPFDIANDSECLVLFCEVAIIASRNYKKISDRLVAKLTDQYNNLIYNEEVSKQEITNAKTIIRKRARGAARSVMPNATETQILVTGNGRAWRNAIEQRCSRFADREIRMAINLSYDILLQDAPYLFGDYVPTLLDDGTRELVTQWRKV